MQSSDTTNLSVPTPKNKHVATAKKEHELPQNTVPNISSLRNKHETAETVLLQC